MNTIQKRNRSDGSISMGVVLALVLMVIGIGFFAVTMYMGSQNETKNATDAGMLNVGKRVVDEISVPLYPTPNELIYTDVCNDKSDGPDLLSAFTGGLSDLGKAKANLRVINRVWAKALQIGINAEAAEREGAGGSGKSNAQKAFDGAQSISNRLAEALNEKQQFYSLFNELAGRNSVKMLGSGVTAKALQGENWQSSFMQRGRESNVTVAPPEYSLPPNFQMPNLLMKSTRKNVPASAKDLWFLRGYSPIKLADRTFWQVPFVFDETPRMVSGHDFAKNALKASPLEGWEKPLPNAFSGEGVAEAKDGRSAGQKAISWALTNPGQNFKMSIPQSFVRIKLDEMYTHWYYFPAGPQTKVEFGDPQKYEYKLDTQSGYKMPLGGLFCLYVQAGDVEVGADVFARTLDQIIFGPPDEDGAKVEAYLVNRANEMVGKVGKVITADELHDCLSNPLTIAYLLAGQREYYLFSADGKSLEVMPKYLALIKAPWLLIKQNEEPDGTEMKLVDDADCPAPILNQVSAKPFPKCIILPPTPIGWGLWDKDVYWTPGSGYNSCLGNLRVKRWTEIYSLAIAAPSLL